MPLCEKCRDFFPPDFSILLENGDFLCTWCMTDKKDIKGYTRNKCVKDYKRFVAEIYHTRNVKNVVKTEPKIPKIIT